MGGTRPCVCSASSDPRIAPGASHPRRESASLRLSLDHVGQSLQSPMEFSIDKSAASFQVFTR